MTTAVAAPAPATGRWQFLDRPAERLRYATIASLITSFAGRGPVVEIGSGDGHLLGWLDPAATPEYIAVDLDTELLSGLRHVAIPIVRRTSRMEDFTPEAAPIAALVASEVLCYVEEPGRHLNRIWNAARHIELAVVSSVLPHAGKPNWQRGYDRVIAALAETQWPILDRIRIESAATKLAWEIVALRPGPAQS